MPEAPPTRPVGIMLTLREIYERVESIDDKMDSRLRRLETQVAALWVTHGILIAIVVAVVTSKLNT